MKSLIKLICLTILFIIVSLTLSSQPALHFDGTNDWIAVNSPLSGNTDYTIEAWFLSENTASCSPGKYYRIIGWNSYNMEIAVCGTDLRFYDKKSWASTGQNISGNQWHHVAVVRNKPNYKVYLDGQLVLDYNRANTINLSGSFSIGSTRYSGTFTGEFFKGFIDEVRIWNVPRSQQEIQATYQQALSGAESGLVGYWPINEGPGSATTADVSSNNNIGVLTNFNVSTAWQSPGAPLIVPYTMGYATLLDQPNGGFVHTKNGQLYFSYRERYAPSKIRCKVYNRTRTEVLTQEINVTYGWNHIDLDVSTLVNSNELYVLEVWNGKGETRYLRFQ